MQTRVIIHRDFHVAEVDPRIYGANIGDPGDDDHRAVVDPSHPAADESGMRTDVLDLARAFQVPCILGPGMQRPSPEVVGAAEPIRADGLVDWCRRTGAEPMLALPIGDAASRRKALGIGRRHGVRMWHLGGVGHQSVDACFDEIAADMRARHPGATLVLGSAVACPEPAIRLLRRVREAPDLVSLSPARGDEDLPQSVRLARAVDDLVSRLDRAGIAGPGGRTIGIQVDRWGSGPSVGAGAGEAALDRAIALNGLIRRADRVRTAFAENVLSGLAGFLAEKVGMGHAPGFYDPILAGSVYGRGISLMPATLGPVVETADGEPLPHLDCAAVRDDEARTLTLFLANRAATASPVEIELHGFGALGVAEHRVAAPGPRLPGRPMPVPVADRGRLAWSLPPTSYGLVRLTRLSS